MPGHLLPDYLQGVEMDGHRKRQEACREPKDGHPPICLPRIVSRSCRAEEGGHVHVWEMAERPKRIFEVCGKRRAVEAAAQQAGPRSVGSHRIHVHSQRVSSASQHVLVAFPKIAWTPWTSPSSTKQNLEQS
eukprot:7378870-Prymnesium_polylepis.1